MRMKPLEIAEEISRKLKEKLGNAIENLTISDITDYPHPVQYWGATIKFKIYNFYIIGISFESDGIGVYISQGKDGNKLQIGNHTCSTMNWDKFVEEIKEEVQLRIPDKYLIAKGYK